MQQMRAVVLTGYAEVAGSLGLDPVRMMRQAGIPLDGIDHPENRIPAASVVRLLERSAEDTGCEAFGLLMAERRTFASLGPVSLLLERLPHLRAVVRASIAFQRHLNEVIAITLEEDHDTCMVKLDLLPEFVGAQMIDLLAGIAHQVLTGASGGRWKPACVHLMRQTPEDATPWRRFYGAPIEFEDSFSGFSSSCMAMLVSNPLADEAMAKHARYLLNHLPIAKRPEQIGERVRRTISQLLPAGRATVDQVAAHLGLSSRSLQRRLDEEGLQFGEMLSSVRQELATAYLAGSSRPVTSVASMLGYSSPSSFTRWFAGSFGMSPQTWRAHNRATGGPPPVWRR